MVNNKIVEVKII